MQANSNAFIKAVTAQEDTILDEWMAKALSAAGNSAGDALDRGAAKNLLRDFCLALAQGRSENIQSAEWAEARGILSDFSRARARQGATPRETAIFVFALKEPLFMRIRETLKGDPDGLAAQTWITSKLIDELGLYTIEVFQKSREEVINRQQEEMLELSTPVVQLWEDVLALPLIGTLDSNRTQIVMESLLQKIVDSGASIAIIDITGVPTVDTLVAQHLLKTVAAARLMGADCIISGIRPQIAQTIVHLGVDLEDVITKATLADAFTVALKRIGAAVVRNSPK